MVWTLLWSGSASLVAAWLRCEARAPLFWSGGPARGVAKGTGIVNSQFAGLTAVAHRESEAVNELLQ